MPLPVVQPCPLGFCTPAGALCFLTGGHFQSFFLVGLPCLLGFCTPAGALCFLSGGHSQLLSPWSCPALAGFARRLGRSASSPADILSPSPRGAWPFLRILHAGWGALLPLRRAFSAPFLVGLGPSFGFCTPAGGAASSPAGFLSPSPRGARPFLRILHAG